MRASVVPALGLLVAMLAGCAAPSRPITIAAALQELQGQLRAAGAVSATGASPEAFAAAVRAAQCEARAADPEVPILASEVTIDLTGSFTVNGGFAVGPAITGGPPFGLSSSLSRGQTQQLTLPLSFAALSELPDVSAARRLALFSALPPSVRSVETRRVVVQRDALRAQTRQLIAGFDTRACDGAAARPAGPFHPMTVRPVAGGAAAPASHLAARLTDHARATLRLAASWHRVRHHARRRVRSTS